MRAFVLLTCLSLAAAQCSSVFMTLPYVTLAPKSKAYLEWPPEDVPGEVPTPEEIALEYCKLNFPKGLPGPPTVGLVQVANPDLTAKLPLTQVSDPTGSNITICEGPTCSIFGVIECVPKGSSPCTPDAKGNIGNGNTGIGNIGNDNSGSKNLCNRCSGSNNVGDDNAGSFNLGFGNSGSQNIGWNNSGTGNTCFGMPASGVTLERCPPTNRGPFYPDLLD